MDNVWPLGSWKRWDIVIRPIPFSIDPTLSSSTFPWRCNFQHINTRLEHFVPDTWRSDWSQPFTTTANTHLTRSSDAGVNQCATCTPILHKYTTECPLLKSQQKECNDVTAGGICINMHTNYITAFTDETLVVKTTVYRPRIGSVTLLRIYSCRSVSFSLDSDQTVNISKKH